MKIGTVLHVGALKNTAPAQCASCPFRKGNDAEWTTVVNRLRKTFGLRKVTAKSSVIKAARANVHMEVIEQVCLLGRVQFACHCTAYDKDMNPRPPHEHKLCPGAVKFFKQKK